MGSYKELEQVNYESALFALAHGIDYELLGDIIDEALEEEAYEVVAGIKRAILDHSETGEYHCKVKPSQDTDELELPFE